MPALDARTSDTDVLIEGATLALPDGMRDGESVLVRAGRIAAIGPAPTAGSAVRRVRANGLLLAPGFLDLHSDAIEKEIRPRPGGSFPLDIAITELDKRLAACGVTTMYHCLCFGESETNDLRTAERAEEIAVTMRALEPQLTVRNRIHVRFEVTDTGSVPVLRRLLDRHGADLFSIMDHTPGQGQFTEVKHFISYYGQAEHLSGDDAAKLAEARVATRHQVGDDHIHELTALCRERGIPMASHDDDTVEKVNWVRNMGVNISEFPVRLDAAREAGRLGMDVLMGAPNILRGGSLTGNLSGQEAIRQGACTVIGSDYAPMSMLHAVFQVYRTGILPLHEAIGLVTRNPARAVGLKRTGALQEGFVADLVLIDMHADVPRIVKTLVGGREVFSAPAVATGTEPSAGKGLPHATDQQVCSVLDG